MRVRKDVWKLAADPTDQTLHWYGVAVSAMQSRDFDNPISWKFQAAVHGYDASLYPPLRAGESLPSAQTQKDFWDNCQHASWWFLPWHRIYVYLFERMCRDAITAAGGPTDWALPYWDYSHPSNAPERTLPDGFRDAMTGGNSNPLFAVRGPGVNSGSVVGSDAQSENTTCLKSPGFTGQPDNGFGGGSSPVIQFSHYTGTCENVPHNQMHDAIGGSSGWMGNPDAAALDPIFWLHHANIDRLWVIWGVTPPHALPPTPNWTSQSFRFYDNAGQVNSYKVSDVLQTTGPLCDYVYDNTTNPLQQNPPLRLAFSAARFGQQGTTSTPPSPIRDQVLEATPMGISQMIGANDAPGIKLGSSSTSVAVKLHTPAKVPAKAIGFELAEAAAAPATQHVYLCLENITASAGPIHNYAVYVNVPDGSSPYEYPELLAGLIARFGLAKASTSDDRHGGQGLNLSFDISELVARLESAGNWNPASLKVTFTPQEPPKKSSSSLLEAIPTDDTKPVTVGRVSVYTQ